MVHDLLLTFEQYPQLAIIISLFLNILISLSGILPSYFLTAANIVFFGFWYGTAISFLGEVIGAIISLYIYRLGFRKFSRNIGTRKYPKIKKLVDIEGKEAFYFILSLRLFPFIPSGIINIAAAYGKVSIFVFALATIIGKVPAILIEAYSVYQIVQFTWQGKIILSLFSISLFVLAYRKLRKRWA